MKLNLASVIFTILIVVVVFSSVYLLDAFGLLEFGIAIQYTGFICAGISVIVSLAASAWSYHAYLESKQTMADMQKDLSKAQSGINYLAGQKEKPDFEWTSKKK